MVLCCVCCHAAGLSTFLPSTFFDFDRATMKIDQVAQLQLQQMLGNTFK